MMLSSKQCEIARLLTKTNITNEQINTEYNSIKKTDSDLAVQEINGLLIKHNDSFDKGFDVMTDDFTIISSKYDISPATLFCLLMEYFNKQ